MDVGGHPKRLALNVWRRIPTGATAVIGEWLYRYW